MKNNHDELISELLSKLNYISCNRTIHEPFFDSILDDWKNISFTISRILILFSRHLLQNLMIKNMNDWYCKSFDIDESEIEYVDIFKSILPGTNNLDMADKCLDIALSLDGTNMYSMMLKGMVYEEKKDFENAKKCYLKSSVGDGYIAGLCNWLAARAADKDGNKEASDLYLKSYEMTSFKEIELIYYARNRIANDSIEKALQLYGQVCDYNWQSLHELFFDLKDPSGPIKVEQDTLVKIEENYVGLPKIGNYEAEIYSFQSKYFLVPRLLNSPTPFELTDQGLNTEGILGIQKYIQILYKKIPLIFWMLKNKSGYFGMINRRYLRSLILSANSIKEILGNQSYNKLSSISNILVDNFGINYQVYLYLNRYYAVPVAINNFSFRDLGFKNELKIKHNIIIYLMSKNYNLFRILKKIYIGNKYKNQLEKLTRYILCEKIVSANNLQKLISRFEYKNYGA